MLYNSKIIITKNRIRVIKTSQSLSYGFDQKVERTYAKSSQGIKSDYSFKRAMDNLVLTIDTNITRYSKFITLTFAKPVLDYAKSMQYFKTFTKYYKRKFGHALRYTRIAERQKERGKKENNDGSWHFHLVVYIDKKLDFKLLKSCWPYGSIDLKSVDSHKNIARYFGKYFTKQKSDIEYHKNLVTHSRGLDKPTIIYDTDNTTFNDYNLLYHKTYGFDTKNKDTQPLVFTLNEYERN